MADEELVRVGASAPRRLIGVTAIGGLGALLLYIAFATPPAAPGWLAFMVAMGFFSLWGAVRVWVATSHELILTEEALMDSDGTVLARFDEIEKVDRSMFAMKPSNGFLVLLKEPRPRPGGLGCGGGSAAGWRWAVSPPGRRPGPWPTSSTSGWRRPVASCNACTLRPRGRCSAPGRAAPCQELLNGICGA